MKAHKEGNDISSMRIALFAIITLSCLLVLALSSYIVVSVIMAAAIEWSGVSMFLGAIGVFLTPAFTGKAIQKRFEK